MKKIIFIAVLLVGYFATAQAPAPFKDGISTKLIQSDTLTTAQRDALTPVANKSTLIFNSTAGEYQFYNPITTSWEALGGADLSNYAQLDSNNTFTGTQQNFNGKIGLNDATPTTPLTVIHDAPDQTSSQIIASFSDQDLSVGTGVSGVLFGTLSNGTNTYGGYVASQGYEPLYLGTLTNRNSLQIADNGALNFNKYGLNNITGTPAYSLAVDASGNVIEAPLSSGSDTSEWATSTGTRAGGDLVVTLGDYDDSGNGTKLTIDDANGASTFSNSVFSDIEIGTSGNQADISITGNSTSIGASISTLENMHIQSVNTTPASATTRLTLDEDGIGINANSSTFTLANKGYLKTNNLTAQRDYELPDASGTIALTSDITGGGHTIQDEGVNITQKDTLNFTGAGVSVANVGDVTTVTINGGAGNPAIYIVDEASDLTGDQSANANKVWSVQGGTIDMASASITLPTGVTIVSKGGELINGTIDLNGGQVEPYLLDYRMTYTGGKLTTGYYLFNPVKNGITQGATDSITALANKTRANHIRKQHYDLKPSRGHFATDSLDAFFMVWNDFTNSKSAWDNNYPLKIYPDTDYTNTANTNYRVYPTNSLGNKLFIAYEAHNSTFKGGNLWGDRFEHDYKPVEDNGGFSRDSHEFGSMIGIIGCHGFTVDGVYIANSHGDGMGIGPTEIRYDETAYAGSNGALRPGAEESRNITVKNCTFYRNRRNGISVVDGFNGNIFQNDFIGTGAGWLPIPDETKDDFDGVETTWTLATNIPANGGWIIQDQTGATLKYGTDFTVTLPNTVTFTDPPSVSDTMTFIYYTAFRVLPGYAIDFEPYRTRVAGIERLYEITKNWTVSECTFRGNYSGDINMFKGERVHIKNSTFDNRIVALFGKENLIEGITLVYNDTLPVAEVSRAALTATSAIVNNEGVTEEIVYDNTFRDITIKNYPIGMDLRGKNALAENIKIYDVTEVGINITGIRDSHLEKIYIETDSVISGIKSSSSFMKNIVMDKININATATGSRGFDFDNLNGSAQTNTFIIKNSIINAATAVYARNGVYGMRFDNNETFSRLDLQNIHNFEITNNRTNSATDVFLAQAFNASNGYIAHNRVSGNSASLPVIKMNAFTTSGANLVDNILIEDNFLNKTSGSLVLQLDGHVDNFTNILIRNNETKKDASQTDFNIDGTNVILQDNFGRSHTATFAGSGYVLKYKFPNPACPSYADNATALATLGEGWCYKNIITGQFDFTHL